MTVKPRLKVIKKNKKHPGDLASKSSGLGAIAYLHRRRGSIGWG